MRGSRGSSYAALFCDVIQPRTATSPLGLAVVTRILGYVMAWRYVAYVYDERDTQDECW